MAPSREIEKLQRRWQENPLGLTFAPLAEAYRKEGRLPDALELLEIGLAQHPNYVPAHIVRGRCYLDGQAESAAAEAFSRVLELDPENVIGLKGLADIAERAGRYPDAARHLERLLEIDRSHDEARSQLARVRAAGVMPAAALEPAPEPEAVIPPPAAPEEPAFEPTALEPEPWPQFVENAAGPIAASSSPSAETVEIEPEAVADETASIEADDQAAVAGMEADPELVVTETMAEVFLRQGHRELALAVYLQLAGRSPDDSRIREAIGQLEAELKPAAAPPSLPAFSAVLTGGTSVRSFFEQLLSATRPRPADEPVPPGLSLGSVFGEESESKPEFPAAESGPSYDEFYAEEPGREEEPAGRASQADDLAPGDDLESFTSWLKGLRR